MDGDREGADAVRKNRKRYPPPPVLVGASARVRRFERFCRLRRLRNLVRHLKSSYRVQNERFEVGIARARHARIVRFHVIIGCEEGRSSSESPERREGGHNFNVCNHLLNFSFIYFTTGIAINYTKLQDAYLGKAQK